MSFKSTQQKGNIVKGKLKSQKELKKITSSDEYKKAGYQEKNKMLNVATHKRGALVGGQKKLDKNNNNRIDEQDFKILKAEKAKGRGMGLQDEKVKPGKVMKAKKGSGLDLPVIKSVKPEPKKNTTKTNPNKPRFSSMEEMRRAKGFKPGETASQFNKRKAELMRAKDAAKALGTRGKIALGVAAAGVGAVQYLKSKMKKKKEEPKKKMGGGMMKKYKSGGSAPMKKERLFEGDRGRRRNELIKNLKGAAKATPLGLGIKVAETAKKLKEKMSNKMGGGMMQRPMSYNIGGRAQTRGRAARKPSRQPQDAMAKRKFQKGVGRSTGEDSSVTLGKFMKSKVDALNESVAAGGMKRERVTQGSRKRRKEDFIKDVAAGKYKKPNKDAAYYKSIGLTGERGDRAVKDFFKPESLKSRNQTILITNKSVGGSVTVKTKLGKNKPTKLY
jgi:hypothetical protein